MAEFVVPFTQLSEIGVSGKRSLIATEDFSCSGVLFPGDRDKFEPEVHESSSITHDRF